MRKSWKDKIDKDYIRDVIQKKIKIKDCYPEKKMLWDSFNHFEYEDTKVVFLFKGNLPIITNEATTKSLRDLLYKYECDITIDEIFDYSLDSWKKQGILLLNDTFTIPKKYGSHIQLWIPFISDLIEKMNKDLNDISWVFFSNTHAHLINNPSHRTLLDLKHYNPFEWVNQKHNIKFL